MSLPVSASSANTRDAPTMAGSVVLVHVRVMGQPEAVAEVARLLRGVVHVAEESDDVPRRRDLGVRRYLTVLLTVEGTSAGPAEAGGRG